jgi:hypothetical protein
MDLLVCRPFLTKENFIEKVKNSQNRITFCYKSLKSLESLPSFIPPSSYLPLATQESIADDSSLPLSVCQKLLSKSEVLFHQLQIEACLSIDEEVGSQEEINEARRYIEFILQNMGSRCNKEERLRGMDRVLWRVQIDLENVEHMIKNMQQ